MRILIIGDEADLLASLAKAAPAACGCLWPPATGERPGQLADILTATGNWHV